MSYGSHSSAKGEPIMADVADLNMRAKMDASQAKSELGALNEHVEKSGGFFKNAASAMLGFVGGSALVGGVTTAFSFLKDQIQESVKAASASQNIQAQLNQALTTTRGSSGQTAVSLNDLAEKLSLTTTFSKDTTLQAEVLALRFQNIGGSVFPQVVRASQDLSARMGIDLNSAIRLVGRATDDPIKGLNALSRLGVTFDAQQKELIKNWVAHGETAKAQGYILDQLSGKFGGAATAAGGTMAGQLKILQNSFEETRIKIGSALIPILQQLLTAFAPIIAQIGTVLPPILKLVGNLLAALAPLITQAFSALAPIVTNVVGAVSGFFASLNGGTPAVGKLKDVFASLQPIIGVVKDIVSNLAQIFKAVAQEIGSEVIPAFNHIVPIILPIIAQVGKWVDQLVNVLGPALAVLIPYVIGVATRSFQFIADVVKLVWPAISTIISTTINVITGIIKLFTDLFKGNWGKLWDDVKGILGAAASGIVNLLTGLAGGILGIVGGLKDKVLGAIGSLKDGVLQHLGLMADGAAVKAQEMKVAAIDSAIKQKEGVVASMQGQREKLLAELAATKDPAKRHHLEMAINAITYAEQQQIEVVKRMKKQKEEALAHLAELKKNAIQHFADMVGGVLGNIGDMKDKGIKAIKDFAGGVVQFFKDLPGHIWDVLKSIPDDMYNFGKKIIQKIIDGLASMLGQLKDALGNVKNAVGDVLGGIGGAIGSGFQHLGGHASGTVSSEGGLHWLGENEPELVVGRQVGLVPRGAAVYPISQLSGGGQSITINHTSHVTIEADGRTLAEIVARELPKVVYAHTGMRGTN